MPKPNGLRRFSGLPKTLDCMEHLKQGLSDASFSHAAEDLVNTVIYSTIVKGFTMSRQHDKAPATVRAFVAGLGNGC